uniref:Mitochondrial fission process protein 1 n=1 Tax=Varanus komodoensis TaxID=61221 RepID=A0A8D2KTF8_VARKO
MPLLTFAHSLAGYANEVGESFRAIVPVSVVWASYGLATAYVTADAVDKGKKAAAAKPEVEGRTSRAAVAVVDTFVWQALASVAIPGFTINRICATSLYLMGRMTRWPLSVRKWATTAVGLSAIPFIIKPIDRYVPLGHVGRHPGTGRLHQPAPSSCAGLQLRPPRPVAGPAGCCGSHASALRFRGQAHPCSMLTFQAWKVLDVLFCSRQRVKRGPEPWHQGSGGAPPPRSQPSCTFCCMPSSCLQRRVGPVKECRQKCPALSALPGSAQPKAAVASLMDFPSHDGLLQGVWPSPGCPK